MAQYDITTSNSALVIDTQYGFNADNGFVEIDDNHIFGFFSGKTGAEFTHQVQVFTINTSTWAVTTANSRLVVDSAGTGNGYATVGIDTNHFLVFWQGVDNDGFAQVFTVNTTTWAVTTANSSLEFDATQGSYNVAEKLDANHFINCWTEENGYLYTQVFTVNTSTWAVTTSAASIKVENYTGCQDVAMSKIDDNHFIVFYLASADDGYAIVLTVNTSNWTVTTSGRFEFDDTEGRGHSCAQIDSNHFINFWTRAGGYNAAYTQILVVNTSSWTISTAGSALNFAANTQGNSCFVLKDNYVVNNYVTGNNLYSQTFVVNTSTWAITTAASALTVSSSNSSRPCGLLIDTNHFFTGFSGSEGGSLNGQILQVDLTAPSSIKSINGLAKASVKSKNGLAIASIKNFNGLA